jgi:hypothetical protein
LPRRHPFGIIIKFDHYKKMDIDRIFRDLFLCFLCILWLILLFVFIQPRHFLGSQDNIPGRQVLLLVLGIK